MNIAESIKSHYETEDFKSNYSECLFQDNHAIKERIKNYCANSYEFFKFYGYNHYFSTKAIDVIYDTILDNIEEFTKDFNGYYVGFTSLDSVSFGEQEEQLTGIYNHNTGKEYSLKYLKSIFEKEDYVINDNYAYYNLDGGIHIDLLNSEIPYLKNFKK